MVGTLVIVIGFGLFGISSAWALASARGPFLARATLVVALTVWSVFAWLELDSFRGWPTSETPPARDELVASLIREPDPLTHDKGAIYVWLLSDSGTPRAYRLPYKRQTHEQLERARKLQAKGYRVGIKRTHRAGSSPGKWIAYQLPPPGLPKKERH